MALAQREEIELTADGVAENRRYFLIDPVGRFYAGIRNGRLVQITPTVEDGRLSLAFPDGSTVDGDVELGEPVEVDFYGRPVGGRVVRGPWAAAVSEFAGRRLRLVRAEPPGAGVDRGRGPVTLVSRESVDELARRAGARALDPRRFRMLVGVEGCRPHEEDEWLGRRVRLGNAVVVPLEPVARCAITTQSPKTGLPDFDTLREIRSYRGPRPSDGRSLDMGVFGRVEEPGRVRVGDAVEVLVKPS